LKPNLESTSKKDTLPISGFLPRGQREGEFTLAVNAALAREWGELVVHSFSAPPKSHAQTTTFCAFTTKLGR
jgi:hypothetical protein